MKKVCDTILDAVGNAPLVRINHIIRRGEGHCLAKVETFNPGNSIKDRMAIQMIEDAGAREEAQARRHDHRRHPAIPAWASMAAVVKGYKCIFTTTDKQSKERWMRSRRSARK